jgi:dimethylargininase
MLIAITRDVSPAIAQCALTHIERRPIDYELACAQHRAYAQCLKDLGCEVIALPAEPDLPDSVFVEDAAIVLDELAIITRPGHAMRRAETPSIEETLRLHRPIERIEAPATLDGGDVLVVGRTVYVGLSQRTNEAGAAALRRILAPHGYTIRPLPIDACLHLKSACTHVGRKTVLINRRWVDGGAFGELDLLDVHEDEPAAANALLVRDTLIYPAAYPKTRRRLEGWGFALEAIDLSELAKAEGAVTCCSLIFRS